MDNTETQLVFPSPSDPGQPITLNLAAERAHVLKLPTPAELNRILTGFENQILDLFWEKGVLAESPYQKGVPYGIHCSGGGHSVIPIQVVLAELGIAESGSRARRKIKSIPLEKLQTALAALKPKSMEQALTCLTLNGRTRLNAFSLGQLSQNSGSFETLVEKLCHTALSGGQTGRFALCCLISLKNAGWILLPTKAVAVVAYMAKGMKLRGNLWSPEPLSFLSDSNRLLLDELAGKDIAWLERDVTNAHVKARFAVLCSSISSVHDLSWPLVDRILFSTPSKSTAGANTVVSAAIRSYWRSICQRNGPVAMANSFKHDYKAALSARCPDDPRLSAWIELMAGQCERYSGGNLEPLYQAFGHWLTWLASLKEIPGPFEVKRDHINDLHNPAANTFRTYLEKLELEKAKNRNKPLARISDLFDHLVREAALENRKFLNPVHLRFDRFKTPRRMVAQGTHRKRIPSWVLDKLKTFIVQKNESGGFKWADKLAQIDVLQLEFPNHEAPVFCPILPAIIFLMLEYPLRSHQVRWLDSGELDGAIYDFELKTFVPNHAHDNSREEYGVLKPPRDFDGSDSVVKLDFQVAVNKVLLGDRKRANFLIPYVNEQTVWVIQQVIEWQQQYGAPPKRVREVNEPTKERNRNQQMTDFYPDICPLFRYPLQRGYFPPTANQLVYFWGQLCGQWDEYYHTWTDPKTGQKKIRTDVPILSKPYGKYWRTATHDLHSLRVAGVSFLLDAGIPLEVVASIAGHRSLAMTLHYYRADRNTLRMQLNAAYAKAGESETWEALESRLNECLQYEEWLKGTPDGFSALRQARASRIWRISLSGICPGTVCSQGLPKEFSGSNGSDVPGSKCALCKYFIYGPPFLPGLIHEYNCMLFELEQKANRQFELRLQMERTEEKGEIGQLHVLKAETERLELECQLDLTVSGKLYLMIKECVERYNQEERESNPLALTVHHPEEVSIRIEHLGPFQRLKDLVETAELLPASRHTGSELALRMLQDKLLNCLRVNGASCFLAGLPRAAAKKLTLEFARIIDSLIPEEDQREKLLAGHVRLSDFPALDPVIRKEISSLENEAEQLLQLPDPSSKSSSNL